MSAHTHIVCMNKHAPMPDWLRTGKHSTGAGVIAWRYWMKIWHAQPDWANTDAIRAVYRRAAELRAQGRDVHVDHIVPLKGQLVCGLHVHNNLRIIEASENLRRSNHSWPGMPYEQQGLFDDMWAHSDFELGRA